MKHLSLQKKPPFCSGMGGGSNTRTSCGEKVLYHRGRDQESGAGTYKISYLDLYLVIVWSIYVGVSKNMGTPKWMVYNGKPY